MAEITSSGRVDTCRRNSRSFLLASRNDERQAGCIGSTWRRFHVRVVALIRVKKESEARASVIGETRRAAPAARPSNHRETNRPPFRSLPTSFEITPRDPDPCNRYKQYIIYRESVPLSAGRAEQTLETFCLTVREREISSNVDEIPRYSR